MCGLVCLYASNLLKPEVIIAACDNLGFLNFANEQRLANEKLGLGTDTCAYISQLEEDFDSKPFYSAICHFYVAILMKMIMIQYLKIWA